MTIQHLERPAASEPDGLLVLFHGRGADENDLYPLLDLLDPQRRLLGVTPRGPLSLPPGGAHWYAVQEIGYPDPPTFLATYERASEWLDALSEARGVPLAERARLAERDGRPAELALSAQTKGTRRELLGPIGERLLLISG